MAELLPIAQVDFRYRPMTVYGKIQSTPADSGNTAKINYGWA